jgi:hypothetical protein
MRRLFLPVESELPGLIDLATQPPWRLSIAIQLNYPDKRNDFQNYTNILIYYLIPVIPLKMPGEDPAGLFGGRSFPLAAKAMVGPVILVVRWRIQLSNASLSQSWGIASEAVNSTNFKHFDQKRLFS